MAIGMGDGSIILTTKVDTSGINTGLKTIKSNLSSIGSILKVFGLTMAISQLVSFSKAASNASIEAEANAQRLKDIYGEASVAVGEFIDANARAIGMSKNAAASFSAIYGNLFSVWADQATNANLTNQYLQMTAVVASKTGRSVADVQERIRSGLLGNTEAIEDLGIFVNVKTIEMTDAFQQMANGKSWEQLDAYTQQQIRTMAILEQATVKYGNTVSKNMALVKSQFNAAADDFKKAWGDMIAVVLMPVLEFLTTIFSLATAGINALMGKTGEVTTELSIQADNIDDSVSNQKSLTKEVKKTGKEMKKAVAGFDELEILTGSASSNMEKVNDANISSAITSPVVGGGQNDNITGVANKIKEAVDFLAPVITEGLVAIGLICLSFGQIGFGLGFIAAGAYLYNVTERSQEEGLDLEIIKSDLQSLSENLSGALTAIGVILLFFGQLGWGIGFIIAGAVLYGVEEAETEEFNTADFQTKLAIMSEAVALALVAIGIMLIFFGNAPLGLGFIVVGKKLLGVSEQKLQENNVVTSIQKFMEDNEKAIGAVGSLLLIIGIILIAFGVVTPVSFGLLVGGASILVAEQETTGTPVEKLIGDFLEGVWSVIEDFSPLLLILAAIMFASGHITPLSLGLLVVGAAGLASEITSNQDSIANYIKETFQKNADAITGLGTVMLLIGILLCFVPGMLGLGLGILVGGAGLLGGAIAFNWDAILGGIKKAGEDVKEWWKNDFAEIFTAKWWQNLAIDCGNGLLAGFEAAVNGIIWLFEQMINLVIGGLNKIRIELPDWDWLGDLAGAKFGVDIKKVDFNDVKFNKIPKLARGAVIPGNREFLAVLGDQPAGQTNIEAPAELIKQMAMEAIAESQTQTQQPIKEEHYYIDEQRLMSIVYKLVQGGKRLNGDSLITEGGLA